MRAQTYSRKASPARAASTGLRPRPFLVPDQTSGGRDPESWLESARRLGHNLDHLRPPSESTRHGGGHSPGCACSACAGGLARPEGSSPAQPNLGGGEGQGTIQLCTNCKDDDCKFGEKCGHVHSLEEASQIWSPDIKKSIKIKTSYGDVSARQNRKAPYIQTRDQDYGNQKAKVDYKDFNRALRGGSTKKDDDPKIAKDLLSKKSDFLKSDLQKRGAATRDVTVNLAESWRKKGAGKIDRSNLRRVEKGEIDLDEANEQFAYVKSADEGRRQVGRIQDVVEGRTKLKDLSSNEREIYGNLSPIRDGDFSSDDEERGKKNKDIAKKRLFSTKHESSESIRVNNKRKPIGWKKDDDVVENITKKKKQ
jgi:hypothetical protein